MIAGADAVRHVSSEKAVIHLDHVPWETYCRLREIPENASVRMTFDRGALVLMSPSKRHEHVSELLGQLVVEWAVARELEFQSCGTVTFQREDLARGTEPDKCFYTQHEAAVRDRDELDLTVDPPPDLAVEVDVTAVSQRKLEIYAAVGVPEIWLWRDETLQVLRLQGEHYRETAGSTALPGFPVDGVSRLLQRRRELGNLALLREFRQMIQPSGRE